MYFDNHLPWDSTKAAKYKLFSPELKERIAALRQKSTARINSDPEYGKLLKQIKLYRKMRNRKTVSLNEETRRKEYLEEKQLIEETERLMEEPTSKDSDNKKPKNDPVLNEAVNIAADLCK